MVTTMDVIYRNKSAVSEPAFEIAAGVKGDVAIHVANKKISEPSGYGESGESISFHNITYTVEQRKCFKKRPPKVILNDVRYSN